MTRHILQISHDYNGPFVSVCRQFVDAFANDEVTTVFLRGHGTQGITDAVGGHRVIYLEEPGENLRGIKFGQIFRLYALIQHQPFELVIAHRYKAIYLAGIMSYFLPLPVLLGIAHEHNVFRRITRKLFVTFWRRRYLIAGVSDSVTKNISEYCPSLIAEKRLFSLPNALPRDYEAKILTRVQAREKLGIDEHAVVVGTIGRLVEKKSLHTLIEAFSKLESTNSILVIVGDGPKRAFLEDLARTLGLVGRVRFLGHVSSAGLLVAAFDLFVLSSGVEEAFGIVLLEAMMAKVPVLSSDAPGPKQVLGESGRLFTTGDPIDLSKNIQTILELTPRERDVLGEEGYQRVQMEYTHEKFCSRLDALPLFSSSQ
tara:strand:+ start:10161 stop:11270 length:1110 start_codon:yes stop_codon:yes gene_type:complete